jgi:protein-disulfide isomerase
LRWKARSSTPCRERLGHDGEFFLQAEDIELRLRPGLVQTQEVGRKSDFEDKRYISAIQKDVADASALGVGGTPSFVIGKTAKDEIEGVRIDGAVPYAVFDSSIKDLLSSK